MNITADETAARVADLSWHKGMTGRFAFAKSSCNMTFKINELSIGVLVEPCDDNLMPSKLHGTPEMFDSVDDAVAALNLKREWSHA